MKPKRKTAGIRHIVVVSDIHAGSSVAVRPKQYIRDDGDISGASDYQKMLHDRWTEFWDKWVPKATAGEPYVVVINGDTLEGRHHRNTSVTSDNLSEHHKIAAALLEPIVAKAAKFYLVRGTEAHVGVAAEDEERLGMYLGAEQNKDGGFSFWDLLLETPSGWRLHFAHHIGVTSSAAYEGSALNREMVAAIVEQGRWGAEKPDVLVRSHRHMCFGEWMPTDRGLIQIVVTPAWQLHTPYTYKAHSMRIPQIGGVLISDIGHQEPPLIRTRTWSPSRRGSVKLTT